MYHWLVSFVVRFVLAFRWKDTNSGRTELDLGLVRSMCRGLQPECVASCPIICFLLCFGGAVEVRIVIYLSVLGRMKNDFSTNGNDCGECCI